MSDVSLPEKVKISDRVLFQEIEGECVLLNLNTEQYFGLDEVGTRFWQLLSKDNRPDRALKSLCAEYDVDAATLERDLTALLRDLSSEGLITVENR